MVQIFTGSAVEVIEVVAVQPIDEVLVWAAEDPINPTVAGSNVGKQRQAQKSLYKRISNPD